MSDKQQLTGRNCDEHLYRVYALKENYVIKDLNAKDAKELTSPGVLVQARDTNGVLLTYNDLVNSADLRKELTGLGPNHFQNLRLERLGEYELAAIEQQGVVQELKDKNAIIDMHKLEDQTLNTFFFKDKEELVAHLTGKKKIRQYSRRTGKEIVPTQYANIPCMFDREIVIVQDGYSLGFINPLDVNDKTLPCPVVGYFEAFKEKIKITDKKTGKVSEIEVSKEDNSGRVIFCHCISHTHTETIIISGKNYRYDKYIHESGEILIYEANGMQSNTEEIRISIEGIDANITKLISEKVIIEINDNKVVLPMSLSEDKKEIIIDATNSCIGDNFKLKITISEGALEGISKDGNRVINDEKIFTAMVEKPVTLVPPTMVGFINTFSQSFKPYQAFAFDFDLTVNIGDAKNAVIEIQDEDGNTVATKTAENGKNSIFITDDNGKSLGKHIYKAIMTYTLDNKNGIPIEVVDNILISDLNAPTISLSTQNINGYNKVGDIVPFNAFVTINKNDAEDLKLTIKSDKNICIVKDDVVNGKNDFMGLKITYNKGEEIDYDNGMFPIYAILEYTLDGIKSSIRAWHAFVLQDRGVFIASLKNTIPSPLPIGTNFDMNLRIFITKDDNDEDLKSIEIFDNKEKIYSTTSVVEYDNYIDVLSVKGIDEKERVYKFVLTYELNGKIKTRENVLVVKTQQ